MTISSVRTVTAGANSTLTVYGPEQSIENDGLLTATSRGELDPITGPPTAQSHSTLANDGSFVADGGSIDIASIGIAGGLPDWNASTGPSALERQHWTISAGTSATTARSLRGMAVRRA